MLTTKQASQKLGISMQTMRRWVHGGIAPGVIIAKNGTWRFSEDDIETWVRDHRQTCDSKQEEAA